MDTIQQIIRQSAIGSCAQWLRNSVLALFMLIVLTSLSTLVVLLLYGQHLTYSYGY